MNWWFERKTNQNHFSFCSIKNDLNTPCLLLATVWLIHQFSTPLLYRYQNAIKFRDLICCCSYHILHFNFENIVKGRYFLFWLKTSLFLLKMIGLRMTLNFYSFSIWHKWAFVRVRLQKQNHWACVGGLKTLSTSTSTKNKKKDLASK